MNKFIHDPDSLASLLGCAFWMAVLAGMMGLLFGGLLGIFR
ncbi:MAG TPA: hypothetical protein VNM14_15535 [Planctomycetota bacterium]|jgi:hypothetical protein|nr:hypothetical protein [Planctomycetota bacterium]